VTRIEITKDLATCLDLRRRVFIEEQGVSEVEEFDGLDDAAVHLLAWQDEVPVGTARLFMKGETGKIGRVCVLPEARGTGLGAALIRAALDAFLHMPPARVIPVTPGTGTILSFVPGQFAEAQLEGYNIGAVVPDLSVAD